MNWLNITFWNNILGIRTIFKQNKKNFYSIRNDVAPLELISEYKMNIKQSYEPANMKLKAKDAKVKLSSK